MNERFNIAILLTCFNRVETTIKCLDSLFKQKLPENHSIEVFLVDDGSTDGTGDTVKSQFPTVNVIQGTGNLFWCGGMRLAWNMAAEKHDYDFYLWLNDDTFLLDNSIFNLFEDYHDAKTATGHDGIITAACKDPDNGKFSYGGSNDHGVVEPNGKFQECKFTNGNLLLIPNNVYHAIGGLSKSFTHGIGDYEYSLRCLHNGFKCWTTRSYLCLCEFNPSKWCDPEVPFMDRIRYLYDPLGLNFREYMIFRKLYWPKKWIIYCIGVHCCAIFPHLFSRLKLNREE